MVIVGITSGIGAGKTTVSKYFEALGIHVCYSDAIAKEIEVKDPEIIRDIKKEFGDDIYITNNDGEIKMDKKKLSSIIFTDSTKLKIIENIIHPKLWAYINNIIRSETKKEKPYILIESAIFFETNGHEHVDMMIGVSAPLDVRIERAMKRDNATRVEVLRRINNQLNEEEKMSKCAFIIENNGIADLETQVLNIHNILSNFNQTKQNGNFRKE